MWTTIFLLIILLKNPPTWTRGEGIKRLICLTFSLLLMREIVIYSLMNHLIKAVFGEQPLAFSSLLLIMVMFVNFLGRPLTA